MNIRRTGFLSPLGTSPLSLALPAKATGRIEVRTGTHAVRDFSRHAAPDAAGLVATLDASFHTLRSSKFAEAIQQFADAECEGRSLIAAGRIGPSQGGRMASRILVSGAVSARACIRQIGRSAARTGNDSQVTFNRPPATDPRSRRRASWGVQWDRRGLNSPLRRSI